MLRLIVRVALAYCALATLSAAAHAQGAIRFVATTGSDANNCTRAKPCRTLQRGVAALTSLGGEVQILDSGEYGPTVYISKSVTISADGVSATVATPTAGQTSVIINNASAVVALRGLLITGGGSGLRAITIVNAAAVHIENCEVERYAADGILVHNVAAEMFVSGSVSRLNAGRGFAYAGTAGAKLSIDNSHFDDNTGLGVHISGSVETSISDSVIAGNGSHGFYQAGGTSNVTRTTSAHNAGVGFGLSSGQMTLEESIANANTTVGLFVAAGATGRISNSTFSNNSSGILNNGTVETRGNNTIAGSGTPVAGNALISLPPT
jgi:hypothetical protein